MASENHNTFIAAEYDLIFLNGKPLVNYEMEFEDVSFSGQTGYTFKIWEDDQDGKLLLSLEQGNGLTLSGTSFFINASAGQMDLGTGKYYYEAAYLNQGGYEIILKYGEAKFIGRD